MFDELLNTQVRLTDDRPQRAAIQFSMIRHDDLSERIIPAHYDMAATLANNTEAKTTQNSHTFLTGESGQFIHDD